MQKVGCLTRWVMVKSVRVPWIMKFLNFLSIKGAYNSEEWIMSEMVGKAVDSCLRIMDNICSVSPNQLPENMATEIQGRLQRVMHLLRGFEKKASLKTRRGREAAQNIEGAAINLEKALSSLESGDPSTVIRSLLMLEQQVESLQKTIERLKRMVT